MTYKITRLDTTDDEIKVVKAVHLEIHKEGQKLYQKVELPDPGEDFTAFENLTENQVVEWCKNLLGEDKILELEARLQIRVDELNKVATETPPWNNRSDS